MQPPVTAAVLAATQQERLRAAHRSRPGRSVPSLGALEVVASPGAREAVASPAAREAVPCPRRSPWSWLRDRWRRHLDLASPWGPISASRTSAG